MGSNDGKNDESGTISTTKGQTGGKQRVESQRRTISPYDLSSNDNPGSVISQPLLNKTNYNEWAGNLRMALKVRKKFGFVDGTISQPSEDSDDFEDWWTNNVLVLSWIKRTIAETVRSNLSHMEIASDYREHIRRRYSVKNGQRVHRIKAELATRRKQGSSIEEYYGKLMKLWTSLSDLRQSKTCSCSIGLSMEKEREEDKLHEFLKGLDESLYGSVKSNLLSRDPLPTLDKAYSVLLQDEDGKHTSRVLNDKVDTMACAVRASQSGGTSRPFVSREERAKMLCTSCGKRGHLADGCFRTLGYPEWWGDRPKGRQNMGRGREAGAGTASLQNRYEPPRANAVQVPAAAHTTQAANLITSQDRVGLTGLNDEQWHMLVNLLNERKQQPLTALTGMSSMDSWIVDSGATNHMTSSEGFLSIFKIYVHCHSNYLMEDLVQLQNRDK